jgi:uncharacterized RmlC-like cupin family protein
MEKGPEKVSASALAEPAAQHTAGMTRLQAFASDDAWFGLVSSQPGEWSGWHHHGDTETYFYVLDGQLQFEYGDGGRQRLDMSAGDFVHMPARVVHRERTAPGQPGRVVLVRVGHGPNVVNVEGPTG